MHSSIYQIPYLILILGPTAVGKTDISFKISERYNAPIISADARQFYRELSIGTAKPKDNDLVNFRHYFINSLSIQQDYSAGRYAADFDRLILDLKKKHSHLILTGGSGMYIDAAVYGLSESPPKSDKIRSELHELMQAEGISALQNILSELDPEYYDTVDLNNPHRLIRAIEVSRIAGRPYSSFRTKNALKEGFQPIWLGLERDREELYERINKRVDIMMDDGLLEEVRSVWADKHLNALQTVGYQELFSFLENELTLEAAIELIKRNSRRYAKRQMTWWRKREEINWFHPDDMEGILAYIQKSIGG